MRFRYEHDDDPWDLLAEAEHEILRLREENRILRGERAKRNAARGSQRDPERKAAIRTYLASSKTACVDCGEPDTRVCDFHHRNPEEKLGDVVRMVREMWSIDQIDQELAKCDCLCKTCHAKRHLPPRKY